MIKLLYCLRRRSQLTPREFHEHWLEHHARFGRLTPQVRRLVQYHTLLEDPIREALAQASASDTVVEPYDGMAVVWFESPQTLAESMRSDNVAAALDDEKLFIDHGGSTAVLCDEHVIVEPQDPSPIVLVECLARRSDIDRRSFSQRWLEHGHMGREAHAMGLLSGYIQNHALSEDDSRVRELEALGAGAAGWDGIVTAYFQSIAMAKELFANPLASEEAYEDEKKFMDHSKALYMLTRRHVVKDLVR